MPRIKPFAITALSLLYTACIVAQPAIDTVKNNNRGFSNQFNYVLSWNVGVFSFPRQYSAININLPYTVTPQVGNTQGLTYKGQVANYFTKAALLVDVFHAEIQRFKHGIDIDVAFSPNYIANTTYNKGNNNFFLSMGYQWLIPLSKKPGNTFVLKPCISAGIYQFDVGYDSTIDNKKKTIAIAGQTYGPNFTKSDNNHKVQVEADYLELFYQNTSFVLIPQLALAHQNNDHTFYYSATVGWVQQVAGDGGHTVIRQCGEDYINGKIAIPAATPYHFSGPIARVSVGFYFEKGRSARKKLQRHQQRMKEAANV